MSEIVFIRSAAEIRRKFRGKNIGTLSLSVHQRINRRVEYEEEEGIFRYAVTAKQIIREIWVLDAALGRDPTDMAWQALRQDRYEEIQEMREEGGYRADGEFLPPERIDQKALDAEQRKLIEEAEAEASRASPGQRVQWEREREILVARLPKHYQDNLDKFLGRQENLRDMYFNIAENRRK